MFKLLLCLVLSHHGKQKLAVLRFYMKVAALYAILFHLTLSVPEGAN